MDGRDREQQAHLLAREETARPFDLEAGPLMRVARLTLAEDDQFVVVSLHHIVADGWSMAVLVDEFWQLYAAVARGAAPALPELDVEYIDYAEWQRLWMSAVDGERQIDYWTTRLKDPAVLQLPIDRARPAEPDLAGAAVRMELDPGLADALRALARRTDDAVRRPAGELQAAAESLHRQSESASACRSPIATGTRPGG